MPWQNLSVHVTRDAAERLEALLLSNGAISVTLADAADDAVLEPAPGTTPLWSEIKLSALFPMHTDLDDLQYVLRSHCERFEIETLADQEWERAWLDDFKPLCFGERLWIYPSGMEPAAEATLVVSLDPGLAFGTGTHPTTGLCLDWLATHDIAGTQVLDYGCGSGILGIAAKKLGALHVSATDIDPQAILATQLNALKNAIDGGFWVCPPDQINGSFDVLIANILCQPLVDLAPSFAQLVSPGGSMILSGILKHQVDTVVDAYSQIFSWDMTQTRAEWALLSGHRIHP